MNRKNENDFLKDMFRKLPEEKLPQDFRMQMMQKITAEAARIRKRNERLGLLSIIAASLVIVGLAVAALLYLKLPEIEISLTSLASVPFYFYIGALVLLLLTGDYIMRRQYRKKHKDNL